MNRRSGGSTDRVRDLEPREAAERFLAHREGQNAASTIRNYRNRLDTFLEWAEAHEEIETMRDLDGYLLSEYEFHLEGAEQAPTTKKGKLTVLVQLLKYCARLEVVEPYLPHLVELPQLDDGDETSDVKLDFEDARALLAYYRNDIRRRGTNHHEPLVARYRSGATSRRSPVSSRPARTTASGTRASTSTGVTPPVVHPRAAHTRFGLAPSPGSSTTVSHTRRSLPAWPRSRPPSAGTTTSPITTRSSSVAFRRRRTWTSRLHLTGHERNTPHQQRLHVP